jgi:hypothetical protein
MAHVRIEFVRLGIGPLHSGGWINLIEAAPFGVADLDVGNAPTAAGDRPTAPSFGGQGSGHARVTALYGSVIAVWGGDPTASETASSGLRIEAGTVEVLPIRTGERLSFLEVL